MKDQFKSLAGALLAAAFVLLGAVGAAQAAAPNIAGAGAAPDIFDTATSRAFEDIRITDGDDDDVVLTISFPAAHGTLPTSASFSRSGDVYTLLKRSPENATQFITNLVFTPTLNSIPIGSTRTTTFIITVTDTNGLSDTDNRVRLEVTPVNDEPTLTGAGVSFQIGDNETNQPFASVQIADVDNLGAQPVTLSVVIDKPAQGNFTNGTLSSFTLSSSNRYTFSGTPAAATTAIQGLHFKPRENRLPVGANEVTRFTASVADNGNPSLAVTNSDTQVRATSINDVPAIGGVVSTAQPVRTGSSIDPFSAVIIADPDINADPLRNGQNLTVTVTLQGSSVVGELNPPGGLATTVTLMNVTASEATAAIQALMYSAPAFPVPFGTTNRMTNTIVVTDSAGGSRSSFTIIDVYSPFTPPGLSGTQADQRVNDKSTIAPFSTVSIQSLNGGAFAVLVQLDNDAKGGLINLSGFVKANGPRARYTFTGPSEAATTAIRQMLFKPAEDRLSGFAVETVAFEISLIDGGSTNGPDSSTTVIVSPVNDRPLIQNIPPLIRITDNETTRPFHTVGISDQDELGTQSVHVVVALDDAAKGTFDTNSLGGFIPEALGYSFDGSGARATLAISNLLFEPTANRVPLGESETTVFTITVDDGHGGVAVNSGTSVRVSSVAGAPEIVVPMPQPISRPLAPPLYPFESVTITDDEDLTVTVAIVNTNQGVFTSNSLASTGFTNSGPGAFTFHGTVEAVSNAITRLDFAPNTNLPPGVVTFSITAVDTTGNSVTETHSILLRVIQRVYVVTKTGDYDVGESDPNLVLGTLRKAVEDAGSNDHITFDLRPPTNGVPDLPATIRLRRPIALTKSVTIDGPGANLLTISGDSDANGTPDVQLFQVSASTRLNRLALTKGNAGFAGGAVGVLPGGNLTISYCAVTESQAEQWGGGIDVEDGGLQMDHCLIVSNKTIAAVGQGGGGVSIYSDQHCVIENTTFSGNSQASPGGLGGGGLYVENIDPATPLLVQVTGCTFRNNSDEASGGTSIRPNVFNCIVQLKNSVLADGRGENLDVDDSGSIVSFGGNVSDDSTRTIFSFGGEPYEVVLLTPPADKTNVAPRLLPLAVNLGQTRTHALDFSSPALAATVTNTLGTDQRGYWRDDGGPDSGAFERGPRRQIIINEFAYDPQAPNTNDEFIEFYVPRAATNINLTGFQLCIGGVLRHTFPAVTLAPGQALVLFSKDCTSTTVPAGVSNQVASMNLLLDNNADTITLKNPAGQVVLEVTYVGSYTSSDPTATNRFGAHQSLTLVPEFTGVYLPYQRGYEKVTGVTNAPGTNSGPGTELTGRSLAGGNAPPIALDDRLTTDEDTALVVDVLDNDVELDGNDFLHVIGAPSSSSLGASLTVTASNITYNPATSVTLRSLPEGSNRVDSFTYSLIDCCNPVTGTNWPTATGGRYTATNFITVLGVNDAPTPQVDSVASNPHLRTFENRVLEINAVTDLLPNDTDPDTDDNNTTLDIAAVHSTSTYEDTIEIVSQLGALVTLELRFNRNETRIIYDPTGSAILNALSQGEVTNDVFYYSLIDSHGAIGGAEVRIQVIGTNDLPTAAADALATDEDTEIRIPATALLANDIDPDTDDNRTTLATLRISAINGATSLVSTTSFGARIRVFGTDVIYTPTVSSNLNALSRKEVVVDEFAYTASDNFGGTSTTTVQVTVTGVNDKPISRPDTGVVDEDTLAIFAAPGLLSNDIEFDINGTLPDDLLRALAVTNAHTAQGATYSINADGSYRFDPRGTFDYLKENQTTNDGFSYTVVDDSYTIANDDEFSVAADAVGVVLPVLANDVTLTGTGGRLRVVSVGLPSDGGTVIIGASSDSLVYSPRINSFGIESFQYEMQDGQGGHDTATVRVKVTVPVRNGNLAANEDHFTVARGTSPILDVLANDNIVPAGGDVLTITSAGPADHGGTVSITAAGLNNAVIFTPATNGALAFPYTERFPYTVSGGDVALATGVVVVTVVNREGILPVNDDVFTVIAGGSSSSLDVLSNDRIVPGTTTNLLITGLDTNGVSGLVSVNTNGSRLLYTPPVGSSNHVESVFHYFINDGSGGTATGAVMVTVMQMGLNANDDFCTVARNSTNTLLVLANDNALPNVGQNLLITTIGLSNNVPNHGGLASISPNGKSIIYAPSPTNLTGEETFTYEITDGTLARAQGRVKIKILDRQGVVNVNPDNFSVVRDTTNNLLRVLRNDNILPDTRERLTILAVGVPTRGGAARIVGTAPNQSVLYSPPFGYVGEEAFSYSVADNRGGTAITTVRVNVGHLVAPDDLFTALSESQDNLLDVLANDTLLPNVTPLRPILSVGSPNHGGTVRANAARNAVLYTPATGYRGLETFSYQVADDSGGIVTAQATVRVLPAGGDRDTASVAITVVGVNDIPTITGTTNGLGIKDCEIIRPFLAVRIADVDEFGLQPLTVIVKLDDAIKGKLRNAPGFVESPAGTYTFHGTGPEATTLIRKIVFDPTDNRIPVPTTEITRFTLCVLDGYVPTPVIDDATTVAVTACNDAPIISGTVAAQTVYHRMPIRLFSSVVITEVDDLNAQPLVVTVTISDPTHGFLSSIGAFVDQGGGVYRLGAVGAGVTAATATETLRGMQFVPTTEGRLQPGQSETTGFTISVEDGYAPAVVDTTTSVVAIHEFVNKLLANDGLGNDSFGLSVAVNNNVVIVGAPLADPRGNSSGAVYVYLPTNNPSLRWVQVQKIVPADGAAGDEFGSSVAVQNDTLVIGARAARGTLTSGAVYVYSRGAGGVWTQTKKILPADGQNNDEFGYSISLDADTLAVGSRLDDDRGTSSGSVYLFGRNQGGTTNWGLLKKVVPADGAAGEEFGRAVSVHGDVLAVGATFDPPPGSAYLFGRNTGGANNWGQIRKLIPSDGLSGDDFGCSLSLGPDTLVVGARRHDQLGNDTGAAYVFARDQGGASNWGQIRKLLGPDSLNNDQFGHSVSLSRDKIVVGMPFAGVDNQSKFGAAYAFARNQGGTNNWGLLQKLERSDPGNNDQFGAAVAVGQDTVVVGVTMDDDLGIDSGSAYVYRLKYNNRPQLGPPILDLLTSVGASFSFTLPPTAFGEPDVNDSFTLTAAFGGSGPVPTWLTFNPITRTFSGVPTAPGVFNILATATDEDGFSVTNSFDIVVVSSSAGTLTSLEAWRLEHFGATVVGNPALEATVWGDAADPDHDGLSNREEYYFGLDPTQPFGGGTAVLSISRDAIPGRVVLHYPRRSNDPRLLYCLESSIDLIHWNDTDALILGETVVVLEGGVEFVRLELSVLPGLDTHQFFRIKVMP